MKRTILTLMMATFACITLFAQKSTIWEKPKTGYSNKSYVTITKVEFAKKQTSVYMTVSYPSDYGWGFAKTTRIEANGKQYPILGGDNIVLDEWQYTDTATWEKDFVLHFPPLPKKTKMFDIIETDSHDGWNFYSIHPADQSLPLAVIPEEYKTDPNEPYEWPKTEYSEEPATIHFKALNYKKGMGGEIRLTWPNITDLDPHVLYEESVNLNDDGCADYSAVIYYPLSIQMEMVRPMSDRYGSFGHVFLAPGKEVTVLIDMTKEPGSISGNFVAIKGYMAAAALKMDEADSLESIYPDLKREQVDSAKTVAEIIKLHDDFMPKYKEWVALHPNNFWLTPSIMEARIFEELALENDSLFNTKEFKDYIMNSRPGCFWGDDMRLEFELVRLAPLFADTDVEGFWPDMCRFLDGMNQIKSGIIIDKPVIRDENLSKLYDKLTEPKIENIRKLKQEVSDNIHFADYLADVEPENVIQTILDKYKGKAVMIDMWATWCFPCRKGHQEMAPYKEEMKDKDVAFVYVTNSSSPLNEWTEMIKTISGEHYCLSESQFKYLADKFGSGGAVPTYLFFNPSGENTSVIVGWPGLDEIKQVIDKAMK